MSAGDTMLQRIREITAQNNAASAAAANAQMQFQAEMSNTAHQREVEDLIKAGLNPVLSANYGASTPNGAMAQTDMSGASAYSGYMGALANAGAIMYSADRQYETQRDFPNTWAGLASRLVNDLGLRNVVRDVAESFGLNEKQTYGNAAINFRGLILDAAKHAGFINPGTGKISIPGIMSAFLISDKNGILLFRNYLRDSLERLIFSRPRPSSPGIGGGRSGGGFGR